MYYNDEEAYHFAYKGTSNMPEFASYEELPERNHTLTGDPLNFYLLDADTFIKEYGALPVTSAWTMQTSSSQFHPDGLFSEEIFGATTSNDRLFRFGYINLKTKILHPKLYRNLVRLKRSYYSIICGQEFAYFDNKLGNFVVCDIGHEDASTGYTFFVSHFHELKFKSTESATTQDRIEVLEKYRDSAFVDKWLVIPAGLREYQEMGEGRGQSEDVNKLYLSLLAYTRTLDAKTSSEPLFDYIKINIQKKICEIYDHILNLLQGSEGGKHGMFQSKFGSRNIAYGGRNVISAAPMAYESPFDSRMHKLDITKVPLIMVISTMRPLTIYQCRHALVSSIMPPGSTSTFLIDAKTLQLRNVEIPSQELDRWTTSDGIGDMIKLFVDHNFRKTNIIIKGIDGNDYYPVLIYDTGKDIFIVRNLDEFRKLYEAGQKKTFDPNLIRPMTYQEFFYIAAYLAADDKYMFITRYPAITLQSCYPTKIYTMTTNPGRRIKLKDTGDVRLYRTFPEYPILNEEMVDSTVLHPSRLVGLGGDHDGDMISNNPMMNKDSTTELKNYMESKAYMLDTNGRLTANIDTSMAKLVFFCLSKMPRSAA